MGPQENLDLVHRFVRDVLNKNDHSKVAEMVSEDFVRHDSVRVERGTGDVKKFLDERHDDYDRLEWIIDQAIAHGDYVAAKMSGRAIHRDTGKEVTGTGLTLVEIKDGKIVSATSEWDRSNLPGGR